MKFKIILYIIIKSINKKSAKLIKILINNNIEKNINELNKFILFFHL